METLQELDENTAFNAMIWGLGLLDSGNSAYQNSFYLKQSDKLTLRYKELIK